MKQPSILEFESPAEAKGFKASVKLDSTNIDFSKGVTGVITFSNLTVQCLAIFGCLLRKEDITVTSTPLNKGKLQLNSDELSEYSVDIR